MLEGRPFARRLVRRPLELDVEADAPPPGAHLALEGGFDDGVLEGDGEDDDGLDGAPDDGLNGAPDDQEDDLDLEAALEEMLGGSDFEVEPSAEPPLPPPPSPLPLPPEPVEPPAAATPDAALPPAAADPLPLAARARAPHPRVGIRESWGPFDGIFKLIEKRSAVTDTHGWEATCPYHRGTATAPRCRKFLRALSGSDEDISNPRLLPMFFYLVCRTRPNEWV